MMILVMVYTHGFTPDLDDKNDIIRAVKDLNRKANSIFCIFRVVDPFVTCSGEVARCVVCRRWTLGVFKSYCLSLYGCSLWSHSSSSLKLCEVALKKSLRKLWCLPHKSHSTIVHCVAQIDTISAIALSRFHSLRSSALSSSSPLVKSVFSVSSSIVYSFTGYNNVYGANHVIDIHTLIYLLLT